MKLVQHTIVFVMLCLILITSGCSPFVEKNVIEEIAPVIFWSISEGQEQKLKISTLVPPLPEEEKDLYSVEVDLLKEGRKDFNLIYYRELKPGQIRILFIDEAVAKKGLAPILNTVLTNPEITQRLYLAIFSGNMEEYIKNQLNQQKDIDYYLYLMFQHYEKQGQMTVVNLHQFVKELYDPYTDPISPVFKVNRDNFTYEGTAFFREDQLKETVKKTDDHIIQLIYNYQYLELLPIGSLSVTLGHVRSDVQIEFDQDYSTISIRVGLTGRMDEYQRDKNIRDRGELEKLSNEIEAYLEKQTLELFKKMQQLEVDPLQIGTHTLKPFSKPISEEEWLDYWKEADIQVKYKLHIQPLTNVNI